MVSTLNDSVNLFPSFQVRRQKKLTLLLDLFLTPYNTNVRGGDKKRDLQVQLIQCRVSQLNFYKRINNIFGAANIK